MYGKTDIKLEYLCCILLCCRLCCSI